MLFIPWESKWRDIIWEYVKPGVDYIKEEMHILLTKAAFMRRYKFVAEQNLQLMEDVLDVFQDSLVGFEEATKKQTLVEDTMLLLMCMVR
jgi:hypothetical protein